MSREGADGDEYGEAKGHGNSFEEWVRGGAD